MSGPHRVPPDLFRFTTTGRAELSSALLHAFGEADERLETALGIDEVRASLRSVGWYESRHGSQHESQHESLTDEQLAEALSGLVRWGLLDVIQNHAENYRTAAEYERRNLQYSLTRRGEAAYAGMQHALAVLESTGALQTAVLDAIADRLAQLHRLLAEPAVADRRVFSTLQELEGHLDALRNNTRQFNGELQRLLRSDGPDPDTFREVKTATVAYLQEFLTNLDGRAHAIREALRRIEDAGVDRLHERALAGAELPPAAGQGAAADWLAHRRARWAGLRRWFYPDDGGVARVEQLHAVARRAIVSLLQALDRIAEARRRSSSAVADFRALARAFATAPSERDLHRLWGAAFGLTPARHAHLAHPDPELVTPGISWADAPPVEVSALLRRGGPAQRFGRAAGMRDVAALKRARQAAARRERAQLEAAWRRLHTDGPVRLSALGRLEHEGFERLLELLGRALAGRADVTGARRGVTSDGRIEISLRPTGDGQTARLRTGRGEFRGPDFVIDVHPVVAGRSPRGVAR
jgi:uncharacterized protein (TIGR02677 family)